MVIATMAGVISIVGGVYSIRMNFFQADKAFGEISGTVRDERIAKPLRMVPIEIADAQDVIISTLSTDDNGRYFLKQVKEGNYKVKAKAVMHTPQTKTVSVEKNRATTVDFNLIPEETRAVSREVSVLPDLTSGVPPARAAPSYPAAGGSSYAAPYSGTGATGASAPTTGLPMSSSSYGGDSTYSQSVPTQSASARRRRPYPRRTSYSDSADSMFYGSQAGSSYPSSTASAGSSQSSNALVQVGTQLLGQMLANQNKKAATEGTTVTTTDSGKTN